MFKHSFTNMMRLDPIKLLTLNIFLVIPLFFAVLPAHAQEQYPWTAPLQIPTGGDALNKNTIVADQYGFVHLFWFESGGGDTRVRVLYSRYDGETWSTPNDVFVTMPLSVSSDLSASTDTTGSLHLIWVDTGKIYYSFALAQDALSARNWYNPILIADSAQEARVRADSNGILHVLYTSVGTDPGVFYIRSEDNGFSWSAPFLLDPDKPSYYDPKSISLELDEQGGIHALWYYSDMREDRDDWLRYAHSLDTGLTWTLPVTIDEDIEHTGRLTMSGPLLKASADQIHIVWGAKKEGLIHRMHSYSNDRGLTWRKPVFIFGDLNGQAWDGLAVDGSGRLHFLGQIRYPQGIYHAYWDRDRWSGPELIYLIARDAFDPMGNRIHAHYVRPIFRLGNQLIIAFTPNSRQSLFVMQRYLDDISSQSPVPLPTSTSAVSVTPDQIMGNPDALPEVQGGNNVVSTPGLYFTDEQEYPSRSQSSNTTVYVGIIPGLIFIGGVLIYWFSRRK